MAAAPLVSIEALGFKKIASLYSRPDRNQVEKIAYKLDDKPDCRALWESTAPATYMWVVAGEDRPVYIGEATRGMEKRAAEHEGGFHETHSARQKRESGHNPEKLAAGPAHAKRIRELWAASRQVELWVRPAGRISLFMFEGSLVSTEEEMLIEHFNPPWNKEGQAAAKTKELPKKGRPDVQPLSHR